VCVRACVCVCGGVTGPPHSDQLSRFRSNELQRAPCYSGKSTRLHLLVCHALKQNYNNREDVFVKIKLKAGYTTQSKIYDTVRKHHL
jgi:hypothetical protein